ncbi:MAG: hypothetical protein ACRC47_02880 [Shewanella sp.]
MKTNLEKYAAEMSRKIKQSGADCYHWSEISTVIDELLKYADFKGDTNQELKFVGFTSGANINLLNGTGYGAMYSDTKQNCYIPLYMLKQHEHRVELTHEV